MKCARLDGMVEGEAHSSGLNLKDHVAAVKSLRCEGRATEYDVVDRRSIEHNANLEKSRSVVYGYDHSKCGYMGQSKQQTSMLCNS